jgi:hypothetical protein
VVRVWVLVVVMVFAGVARADETVTVTLSDAGPDRPVPIGSSFFLTGTVDDDVRSVQAVVVRYGHPSLWPIHEKSCTEIGVELQSTAPSAKPLPLGRTDAKIAFPGAAQPSGDLPAYVTAAWARNALVGPQPYSVLVPNDSSFFEAGYQYCLFVVQGRVVLDDRSVEKILEAHAQSCAKTPATCLGGADPALKTAEDGILKAAGVRGVDALRLSIARAVSLFDQFAAGRAAFSADAPWFEPPAGFVRREAWLRTDSDHFAMVLANRLTVTQNGLVPQVVKAPTGAARLAKWTDGPLEVDQLQLLDDGFEIRAGNSAKVDTVVLKATTRDVIVHGDISIRDVQLAIDARVGFAPDREVTLADVRKALAGLTLVSPPEAFADARVALVKLVGLQAAVARAASVCKAAPAAAAPDSDAAIACAFGQWLADNHYHDVALATATNGLRAMLDAKDQWERDHLKLVVETGRVSVQNVASQALRFDQRTWLFTYLTPVVGYAFMQDSFSLFYTGLQLHFWPNPTNQPLWSHGVRDLRRAFAIEVGMSPQSGSFGPDARYTGIDGIPPLFVGLALHPVPYTSFTVGGVFFERRQTALAAEDPRFHAELFIGVNVQVNIPDLVRQLSTPTTSAYLQGQ